MFDTVDKSDWTTYVW